MDTVMTKPWDEALSILQEEVSLLDRVLQLEEKKYQALKDVNLEELMTINDREEILLQEIHLKEEKRQHLFQQIHPSAPDFHTFLSSIDNEEYHHTFQNIYIQLAELRDRIKMQSEENKHLIQLNSEIISMTLGLFQKTHGETYQSPQAPAKPSGGGSFLVNHVV
ncbi:MAG: flagellar protein FlgN [Brevinematales bacterium]|nr:flagellar protein FlgN [Brevinematales bacterium]